jgi:hypothetical protein
MIKMGMRYNQAPKNIAFASKIIYYTEKLASVFGGTCINQYTVVLAGHYKHITSAL